MKRNASERGAEMVEMAFVLPMLLALLIGMFWAGRAYNIYAAITRAAREGARLAVAPTCGTCTNKYPTNSDVQTVIDNVLTSNNLATSASGVATFTIQEGQKLGYDPDLPGATWTIVTITYPFQFSIPFLTLNTTCNSVSGAVCISSKVQMMEELGGTH